MKLVYNGFINEGHHKMNFYGKDFLRILDFSEAELSYMLGMARKFKELKHAGMNHKYFPTKNIAILFEKTSTRTRCSFEVAGYDLGMGVTYLDPAGSQIGHKESIADTARVLSRMYSGIEYRGFDQKIIDELAKYATVPVWNGLTNEAHPTQALADFMTLEEHFGRLKGLTLAFVGDTRNNIGNSLMAMSAKTGVNFIACGPASLKPADEMVKKCQEVAALNGCTITVTSDINALAGKADAIYTDVWLSLGEDPAKWKERINLLSPYQVNAKLMSLAKPTAVFMHCLPSFHDLNTSIAREVSEKFGIKEMEVTNEVFESERSIVFDQAENRMHTIKSVVFLTLYDADGGGGQSSSDNAATGNVATGTAVSGAATEGATTSDVATGEATITGATTDGSATGDATTASMGADGSATGGATMGDTTMSGADTDSTNAMGGISTSGLAVAGAATEGVTTESTGMGALATDGTTMGSATTENTIASGAATGESIVGTTTTEGTIAGGIAQ